MPVVMGPGWGNPTSCCHGMAAGGILGIPESLAHLANRGIMRDAGGRVVSTQHALLHGLQEAGGRHELLDGLHAEH